MATIKKRGNSYLIRVSCGYDVNGKHKEQSMTWRPDEGMTSRQIEKELNRQAVMFEEKVNHGFKTTAMKFQELAEEWFENYAKNALRSTTYERMLQLTHRVYPAIGHLRIDKITARHLQGFVNSLAKEGANEKTGKPLAPKTIRHNLSFIFLPDTPIISTEISGRKLLQNIRNNMGWTGMESRICPGTFLPGHKAVCFDLNLVRLT